MNYVGIHLNTIRHAEFRNCENPDLK